MVRSSRFGSIRSDIVPYSDSLSLGLQILLFNPPLPISRRLILQQARGQIYKSSHCLSAHDFMFYFTPLRGFFSPFRRRTISLSVSQECLALRGGPRRFTRDSTCPMLLGIDNQKKQYKI